MKNCFVERRLEIQLGFPEIYKRIQRIIPQLHENKNFTLFIETFREELKILNE